MEIKFGETQTPVLDVESSVMPIDPSKLTAGGTVYSSPAVVPGASSSLGNLDYLPGFGDIILPRLNMVQGSGLLKDSFPQGAIVFGQNLVLFTLPIFDKATGNVTTKALPPVNITVLGFRPTRYVEKVAGGAKGMLVNTESEVRAAGGTLDYNEWKLKEASGMKRFEYLAEAFIAVRRPEHVADDGTVFVFDVGGEKYALALFSMKASAYTQCAKKVFFTARNLGCLADKKENGVVVRKGGYYTWSYNLSTRSAVQAGNTYYVPLAIPNAPSTKAMLEFVNGILSPAA